MQTREVPEVVDASFRLQLPIQPSIDKSERQHALKVSHIRHEDFAVCQTPVNYFNDAALQLLHLVILHPLPKLFLAVGHKIKIVVWLVKKTLADFLVVDVWPIVLLAG